MQHHRTLILLLILGLALRVTVIHYRPAHAIAHGPDEYVHHRIAQNLAHGDGFSLSGRPTAFRDLFFPLTASVVMCVTGDSPLTVLYVNSLLSTLTAFLLYLLGRRRFSPRAGLLMAGVWAFYPGAILFSALFVSETLCVFLWVLTLVLYDRLEQNDLHWKAAAAVGVVSGMTVLTRAQALALPAALIVYLTLIRFEWPWRARVKAAAIVAAGCLIVVLPWMIRNQGAVGAFCLNTNSGVKLLLENDPMATGAWPVESFVSSQQLLPLVAIEAQSNWDASAYAWPDIRQHPRETVSLWERKFAAFSASDIPLWRLYGCPVITDSLNSFLRRLPLWLLLFLAVPYMVMLCCGISGFYLVRHFPARGLFILQIFFVILMLVAANGGFRFHFAVMPLLVIGLGALWRPQVWSAAPVWRRLFLLFTLGMFLGIWLHEGMSIAGI
jgi:4-amino-4-deoxy-L-arabinose transferase-like glycosyltransferase